MTIGTLLDADVLNIRTASFAVGLVVVDDNEVVVVIVGLKSSHS